jgi:hypothetical protein
LLLFSSACDRSFIDTDEVVMKGGLFLKTAGKFGDVDEIAF